MIRQQFIILFLLIAVANCNPARSGLYLDVIGKEFADATVVIDGKAIGKMRLSVTPKEDRSIQPSNTNKSGNSQQTYSGSIEYLSLSPGAHEIILQASTGRRLEIEAEVPAGENYVSYSSDKRILRWNDKVYNVTPGERVKVE
jgi:hypothetical protein